MCRLSTTKTIRLCGHIRPLPMFGLYLLFLTDACLATYDACQDKSGTHRACQPGMYKVMWYPTYKLTLDPSSATCGTPLATFKRLGDRTGTSNVCDAASATLQHSPSLMVDNITTTFWQSINQPANSNDLRVNVTLSYNKTFILATDVIVTFNSGRPEQMVLEKSLDYGLTWSPLQYYARNCSVYGQSVSTATFTADNPTVVTCTSKYVETSTIYPTNQLVKFPLDDRFRLFLGPYLVDFASFYAALDTKLLPFLKFTDLRLRLVKPATDGRTNWDSYNYGISNVQVTAWCDCNMHAAYCNYTQIGVLCDCQHNTTGPDCGACLPLYNERPWKAGLSLPYDTGTANECQKCECNQHALSCIYNATYGRGVCQACSDNTRGYHCEMCSPTFYPNISLPLSDVNRCMDCNCDLSGVVNNSNECSQVESVGVVLGQCQCKTMIAGRRCDECLPSYYGLKDGPTPGNCTACACNSDGTVGQSNTCQQSGGQCPCKSHIEGRDCGTCADGFFFFPTGVPQNDCLACVCDVGGSRDQKCNKTSGQCTCKTGVTGTRCDQVTSGTFVPALDTFNLEPLSGGCVVTSDRLTPANLFDGPGFATCNMTSSRVLLSLQPVLGGMLQKEEQWPYIVAVRYSTATTNISGTLTAQVTGSTQQDLTSMSTKLGRTISPICPLSVGSSQSVHLTFNAGSSTAAMPSQNNVTLDVRCQYSLTLELLNAGVSGGSTTTRKRRQASTNSAPDIDIDSLLFLPGLSSSDGTAQYQVYNKAENSTTTQTNYLACLQKLSSLSHRSEALTQAPCTDLFFSVGSELYDGTQPCSCNYIGSEPLLLQTCQPIGGQCVCRPGVSGRTCDTCAPGYFNLTNTGCTACNCHSNGATSGACDMTTGQCPCRPNIVQMSDQSTSGPVSGTCSQCMAGYYGIDSGHGCGQCLCSQLGSTSQQCDESGQCPCLVTVTGVHCDVCTEGTYGFSSTGCSVCNCSLVGAKSGNCDQKTGNCDCKANVEGAKCSDCKKSFMNLAVYNPDGCQPCFCFGHGDSCSSAPGYVEEILTVPYPGSSPQMSTILGDQHVSFGLNITLGVSAEYNMDLYNETIVTISGRGKTMFHKARSGTFVGPDHVLSYVVPLLEQTWIIVGSDTFAASMDILDILSNVTDIKLITKSKGQDVLVTSLALQSAQTKNTASTGAVTQGVDVGYVEQCSCVASHYVTGLSCEKCSTGYMRSTTSLVSSYDQCQPCNCNSRGFTDPPECVEDTGVCLNCRNGTTGDHCEKCSAFVEGVGCDQCTPGYWGLQRDGCRDCQCSGVASQSSVCEPKSGQCPCVSHVTGRTCNQCEENFYGLSSTGCVECDRCYSLMTSQITPLRQLINETATNISLIQTSDRTPALGTFSSRLKSAIQNTEQLVEFLTSVEKSASEISSKISSFNQSLLLLHEQMEESENRSLAIEEGVVSADGLLRQASSNRSAMEASVRAIYANIGELQIYNVVLTELTDNLKRVETYLQSLVSSSSPVQGVLDVLKSLNQSVARATEFVSDVSQKSQDALRIQQTSTTQLLALQTLLVSANSLISKALSGSKNLELTVAATKTTIQHLQDNAAILSNYSPDLLSMSSRTANIQSLTGSYKSQVIAESNIFSPTNINALQSVSQVEPYINSTVSLSTVATLLLWRANSAQKRCSLIQSEAGLLMDSATIILATMQGFTTQAEAVQQHATTSLSQLASNDELSQKIIDGSQNMTQAVASLTQNASAAKDASQQALQMVQTKYQKLVDLSTQAHNLEARLSGSTLDVSGGRYQTMNSIRNNIVSPGQQLCQTVNSSIAEFKDKLAIAETQTTEASQRGLGASQKANELLATLKTITGADAAGIAALLSQVQTARSGVDLVALKAIISDMLAVRESQRSQISKLSVERDVLRDKVNNMKLLVQQIQHS